MIKLTIKDIISMKNKRKLTLVGAIDFFTARALESAGIDIIGFGGTNIEMLIKGNKDGTRATLEEVLFCLDGVRKGAPNTFIMASIPYGYSFISHEDTLKTAVALMKAGADATKIQGSGIRIEKIKRITGEGIPCMGHLGLTPWFSTSMGGLKSVGKTSEIAINLFKDAFLIQQAGAFAIELECVPYKVAEEITKRLDIITIGIGSGVGCDGQNLHSEDILGIHDFYYPKHTKKYRYFYEESVKAFKEFATEVQAKIFPTPGNSFEIDDEEYNKFIKAIDSKQDIL